MSTATAAETQRIQTFERTITRSVGYKYLLGLPEGYEARGAKRWPLLLFLHGSGERGDDVWMVAKHGPPKLLREMPDVPNEDPAARERRLEAAKLLTQNFIVVSPQCQKGRWWDIEAVLALLDDVMATHQADPTRVYLTGLSMGGFASWDLGTAHPDRFAALVPICGGGQFATAFVSNLQKRVPLRTLPVWAFHGAKDETVPLAESERMVGLLQRLKVESVKLTVYPEAKHDSWTETYNNPELYRWLLQQKRELTQPAGGGN